MPKIFVHIGLPKTATTTLQADLFPLFNNNCLHYAGLNQPRFGDQSDLYIEFFHAIKTGNCASIRSDIAEHINKGCSLLFSEEIITVTDDDGSWQNKLRNLALILKDFDYEILLTVREPVSALFSCYVERYREFSLERNTFCDIAKNDPKMHIYHYKKLLNELESHFHSDRIFIKKFEDIIEGELDDVCHLLQISTPVSNIKLGDRNSKKKSDRYCYAGYNFSLSDFIRSLAIKVNFMNFKYYYLVRQFFSPIIWLMKKLIIGKAKINKLSDYEKNELRTHLQKETHALLKYGIKY
ncbi:hypothetical protein D8Y20_00010 [Mariprofundus sp. EBB-1]|uniref:hypothetical protein n=1 Tax=Mariprofundus sp. EBB-1 TaxID=2650971 RepID=UPI000F1BFC9E|nr:hypothetical protein [Mariprofundus sp. EBB-1]RLL55871.1 hypothetical protein D8Y20_00010 [Mariprofundus sp. EBB-1]